MMWGYVHDGSRGRNSVLLMIWLTKMITKFNKLLEKYMSNRKIIRSSNTTVQEARLHACTANQNSPDISYKDTWVTKCDAILPLIGCLGTPWNG